MALFEISPSFMTIGPKVTHLVADPVFVQHFRNLMDIISNRFSLCVIEKVSPTTISITFNDGHRPFHINLVLDIVFSIVKYYDSDTDKLLQAGLENFLAQAEYRADYSTEGKQQIADVIFKCLLDYKVYYTYNNNIPSSDLYLCDIFLSEIDGELAKEATEIMGAVPWLISKNRRQNLLVKTEKSSELRIRLQNLTKQRNQYIGAFSAYRKLEKFSETSYQTGLDLMDWVRAIKKAENKLFEEIKAFRTTVCRW